MTSCGEYRYCTWLLQTGQIENLKKSICYLPRQSSHTHTRSELSSVLRWVSVIEKSEPDWLLPLHHCYNNNELSRVSQPRRDVGPRWPSRERGLFLLGELMEGPSVWTSSGGSLLSSWKLPQSGSSSCNSKQRVAAGVSALNVAIWQRARAGITWSSRSHNSTGPRLVPVLVLAYLWITVALLANEAPTGIWR